MIYYFSGTGNTRITTRLLAQELRETTSPITNPQPTTDTSIGIAFPVYAWGVPNIVEYFLANTLPGLIKGEPEYVYLVLTCGDDMGNADFVAERIMKQAGVPLHAAFSVIMPESYISLPGFDVDTPDDTDAKLQGMRITIGFMSSDIRMQRHVRQVKRGALPGLKSGFIRKFFNRFLLGDNGFKADTDTCTHCGKCARICPVGNIKANTDSTEWLHTGKCTGCLACYHVCPHHSISYGKFTKGKGQKEIYK